MKEKQTHRQRKNLWLPWGKNEGKREIVKEFGINMHTLLYLKWVTNKNLLYNTGNSVQLCDSLDEGWGRDLEENEYMYG